MPPSVYGDTGRLTLVSGVLQPSSTLINIDHEGDHWLVTLCALRTAQGGPITWPTGDAQFTAEITTFGHAGRESSALVDWPINGGTFCIAGSSLRMRANVGGTAVITTGNFDPDIQFTAWAHPQSGPRQTIWTPRRSVRYETLAQGGAGVRLTMPAHAAAYTLQVGRQAAVASGQLAASWFSQNPVATVVRTDEWRVDNVGGGTRCRVGLLEAAGVAPYRTVPVPPDARDLELTNGLAVAGADLQFVRAVYDLDLG